MKNGSCVVFKKVGGERYKTPPLDKLTIESSENLFLNYFY